GEREVQAGGPGGCLVGGNGWSRHGLLRIGRVQNAPRRHAVRRRQAASTPGDPMTSHVITAEAATELVPRKESGRPFSVTLSRYLQAFRTPKGLLAGVIIVLLTVLAILAPFIFPGGYDVQSRFALQAPSAAHPFGTDEIGRDILVRSVYGLRT